MVHEQVAKENNADFSADRERSIYRIKTESNGASPDLN
jgi:hypothetical protein